MGDLSLWIYFNINYMKIYMYEEKGILGREYCV